MRKIALYIRCSTEEQAKIHEGSLISQRHRLEDYVAARNTLDKNWGKIVFTFIDEARSGKDTNRPQFRELMRAIENKSVDTILVTELSRLSRSIKDFCNFWDFLNNHNTQFLSLREQFDTTTAAGEMMMFSIMNFAQFERKQTSERVSANFQARALRGLYNGGLPPLGFDISAEKKGSLFINKAEAASIRFIFETFLSTGSISQTLKSLSEKGIVTKKHQRRDGTQIGGNAFTKSTLWHLLTNRHYAGEREINKRNRHKNSKVKEYKITKASWPAIVSKDIFEKAQARLKENHLRYKPEGTHNFCYLYSGLLFCPECNTSLVGISGTGKMRKKYVYYAHKKNSGCNIIRVDAEKLHGVFRKRLRDLASHPKLLSQLLELTKKSTENEKPDTQIQLSAINKELRALKQSASNLLDQIQNFSSAEVPSLLKERLVETESKIIKLEKHSKEIDSQTLPNTIDSSGLFEFVKNLDKNFGKLTTSERRRLVRLWMGKAEIYPDVIKARYNLENLGHGVATSCSVLKTGTNGFSDRTRIVSLYTVLNGGEGEIRTHGTR